MQSCAYCDRDATWFVAMRELAVDPPQLIKQPLCGVHDAIVANLESIHVLARAAITPPIEGSRGTAALIARGHSAR